jgi:hypothetical protein
VAVLLDNFVQASAEMEREEDDRRYREMIKFGPVRSPLPDIYTRLLSHACARAFVGARGCGVRRVRLPRPSGGSV